MSIELVVWGGFVSRMAASRALQANRTASSNASTNCSLDRDDDGATFLYGWQQTTGIENATVDATFSLCRGGLRREHG